MSARTVLVFSRCSCRWITASATHLIVVACARRGAGGGLGVSAFGFRRWIAASARRPGLVACAAGRQGAGAWQPLAPHTPYPALSPSSVTGIVSLQAYPASLADARHWASPFRFPARGTSVRAASELPPLRGGDLLRAMTRLRVVGQDERQRPGPGDGALLQVGARGCPLLSHGTGRRAREYEDRGRRSAEI